MSKSVLLIASTREAEEDLKFAETVIKRVMRKFRKPVRCDFLSHLVVGECARSETARRVVAAEIQGHDAVLWNCRSTRDSADLDQMRRELDLSVHAHYIAGRCIICPCYDTDSKKTSESAEDKISLSVHNAEFAARLACKRAAARKNRLSVCTDEDIYKTDALLVREFERAASLMRDLDIEWFSADEAIWKHLTVTPFTDVILAGISCGRTLSLQLGASMRNPGGYVCCEGENLRIYRPEVFPFAEYGNARFARLALSVAAMLEAETEAPAAAAWLRRCVGIADMRCAAFGAEEYRSELLRAIDDRIRKRKA